MEARTLRKLRQAVAAEALMGVDALPVRSGVRVTAASATASVPAASPVAAAVAAPVAAAVAAPAAAASPPSGDKAALLAAIDAQVRVCRKCSLCEGRIHTVFGEGNPDARLMFIGEGPGENEDKAGRPFVGRAGDLLNKQIGAMGLKRQDVFIANVVKCRPPNNRPPTPDEADACFDYLLRQIDTIRPEVIVTLGGPATKRILGLDGITRLRGTWHEFTGLTDRGGPAIPVMPTFHPAYLLRQYTVENRGRVWSDLKAVMHRLGLPEPRR